MTAGAVVVCLLGAAPAHAVEASPTPAEASATASPIRPAGRAQDSFDPTSRAAVALVLVGLFAARRSRARVSR